MFGLVRTAIRFFFIGFAAGVLLAPRAGSETRRLLREKLSALVNEALEIAALPPIEAEAAPVPHQDAPPARPRPARVPRRPEESGA
ncbi:MAG: hypothetical protein ACRDF0_00690, partial [Candidatus Limnocylindria bacterium]